MGKRPTSQKDMECPECGNKAAVEDSEKGEIVCGYCGYVFEEKEFSRRPRRVYTQEDRDKRAQAEVHRGLPTQIGPHYDPRSRGRRTPDSYQTRRLKKWQRRSAIDDSSSTQGSVRTLNQAKTRLNRLSYEFHVPKIVKETAMEIFTKALNRGLLRGRGTDGIIAAAFYIACRIAQVPRDSKKIWRSVRITKTQFNTNYNFLIKELNLKVPVAERSIHIERIGGELDISVATQHLAFRILEKAQKEWITLGRDPKGLAGAALYIACLLNDEKRTQGEIALVAGVTEMTIRNRYLELVKKLKIDLDETNIEIILDRLSAESELNHLSDPPDAIQTTKELNSH